MKITINTIKKTILLVCGLLLAVIYVDADNTVTGLTSEMLTPKFQKITPEAASLGQYGTFNMSEYSGSPNIKVPLCTIKAGDVSVPMELYYDASGIKVDQDATFVGLGWNLSYGGHISHIVCGKDDFREPDTYKGAFNKLFNNANGYEPIQYWSPFDVHFGLSISGYSYNNNGNTDIIYTNGLIEYKDSIKNYKNLLPTQISGGYYTPDIFQASFCGNNVSFVIDRREKEEKIVVLNENPNKYKISYKMGSRSYPYPEKILITDDRGINYEFTAYGEYDWQDSYYLTKIYGPDGVTGKNCIEYEYKSLQMSISNEWRKNLYCYTANVTKKEIYESNVNEYLRQLTEDQDKSSPTTIYPSCRKYYPSKMTTPLEIIEFTLDSTRKDIKNAYAISDIVVKSRYEAKTLSQIHFKYSYFKEKQLPKYETGFTGLRLRLDSVNINDQQYQFDYDNNILPNLDSKEKDYWGYYNGVNNTTLCASPKYTLNSKNEVILSEYVGEANRYASENNCKVGMLNKITYPTGGYTVFEFEANRFNDRYYYPDASDKIASVSSYNANDGSLKAFYDQISINGYYNKKGSLTIIAYPTKYYIEIGGSLQDATDTLFCTIKKKNSNVPIIDPIIYTGNKYIGNFGETVSLTLNKDSIYILETKLVTKANGSPSCADIKVRYDAVNTPITTSTTIEDKNGGYSIGGGLRIKSIMNYDAPKKGATTGEFLNGTLYEYIGGKLLSPTVRLQTHYIDYVAKKGYKPFNSTVVKWDNYPISIIFKDVASVPSYMNICSLGIPATVGYSTVIKKEIDSNNNVLRKRLMNYNNNSYKIESGINAFYYNDMGYLNGKLESEKLYQKDTLICSTRYNYNDKRQGSVLFPNATPLFFNVYGLGIQDAKIMVTMYRHNNIWCYLTSKTETLYDKNGQPLSSNTTSFQYNPTNYQLSDQSVTDGTNTSRTLYSYPASNTLRFMQHILSEVDGVETYRNGTFTGGSKYIFKVHKNPQTGASFSVVDSCCSILPNRSRVREMKVTSYDDYGNIREYKKKDETPVTIIWSYNHQLPIMEIVGSTYTEVCNKVKDKINDKSKYIPSLETASSVDEDTMSSIHNILREGSPNTLVTAYTYSPWHSVSQIIKPNGDKVKYNYDQYGRLEKTSDINDNILQKYTYNYKKEK